MNYKPKYKKGDKILFPSGVAVSIIDIIIDTVPCYRIEGKYLDARRECTSIDGYTKFLIAEKIKTLLNIIKQNENNN